MPDYKIAIKKAPLAISGAFFGLTIEDFPSPLLAT
jgi:hypothetical protein